MQRILRWWMLLTHERDFRGQCSQLHTNPNSLNATPLTLVLSPLSSIPNLSSMLKKKLLKKKLLLEQNAEENFQNNQIISGMEIISYDLTD